MLNLFAIHFCSSTFLFLSSHFLYLAWKAGIIVDLLGILLGDEPKHLQDRCYDEHQYSSTELTNAKIKMNKASCLSSKRAINLSPSSASCFLLMTTMPNLLLNARLLHRPHSVASCLKICSNLPLKTDFQSGQHGQRDQCG